MSEWEEQFNRWSKPPGTTEEQRCEHAEQAIRNAITASSKLAHRNIKVFTQGSYRNNVNVRQDSDVDVAVVCDNTFFYDLPDGAGHEEFNITPATYHYPQFKDEVEQALRDYFGANAVKRGNKAFDLRENTYRVESDVAPFFLHRRYASAGKWNEGVELRSDNGSRVINWPDPHYENGVAKNTATRRGYKGVVRIVKALCNHMADDGIPAAQGVPGFLLECMLYDAPNECFLHDSWSSDVRSALAHLFNNTLTAEKCSEWTEVSGFKWLFRGDQQWTWQQAHGFVDAAWNHVGFE